MVTDGNRYCFKFLRLRRKPEVCDSRTFCFRTLLELSIRDAGQKDHSSGDENGNPEIRLSLLKMLESAPIQAILV